MHHSQQDFSEIIFNELCKVHVLTTQEARQVVAESGILNDTDQERLPCGIVRWEQIVRNCLKSNDYMAETYPSVEHIDGGIKLSSYELNGNDKRKLKAARNKPVVSKEESMKIMSSFFKNNKSTLDYDKCVAARDTIIAQLMDGVDVEETFKGLWK